MDEKLEAAMDDVSLRVRELDAKFSELGARLGLPMTDWSLDKIDTGNALSAIALLFGNVERVTLELGPNGWHLWYYVDPPRIETGNVIYCYHCPSRLTQASLDVRSRFLLRSGDFLDCYLEHVKSHAASEKDALKAADAALERLSALSKPQSDAP